MAMLNALMLVALMAVGCFVVSGQETAERSSRGLIVSRGKTVQEETLQNQCV